MNSKCEADKEQHPSEEKKKAKEDEIRKVGSESPLKGENQVPDFWKKKGWHPNISNEMEEIS